MREQFWNRRKNLPYRSVKRIWLKGGWTAKVESIITNVHLQRVICSPLLFIKQFIVPFHVQSTISIIKFNPHMKCELVVFPFYRWKQLRPEEDWANIIQPEKRQQKKGSSPDLLNQELCAQSFGSLKLFKSGLAQNSWNYSV